MNNIALLPEYPIQPRHIDLSDHLWNAFGNHETEISARWIVKFLQQEGSWRPFRYEEIEAFYNRSGFTGFGFNRLLNPDHPFIVLEGEKYMVTHEFVTRCFLSRPKVG